MQPEDYWEVEKPLMVKIPLSQHIGAPAVAAVKEGELVGRGDCIAVPGEGLSVAIHSSVDGIVRMITDQYIVILIQAANRPQ